MDVGTGTVGVQLENAAFTTTTNYSDEPGKAWSIIGRPRLRDHLAHWWKSRKRRHHSVSPAFAAGGIVPAGETFPLDLYAGDKLFPPSSTWGGGSISGAGSTPEHGLGPQRGKNSGKTRNRP